MAIYTFKCPMCGIVGEFLIRKNEQVICGECLVNNDPNVAAPFMDKILSVPSPMQWGCRKGF
jgi:NMD protein affecting ribosome stability and mRNA decay